MSKPKTRPTSRHAREAAELLGKLIRKGRIERRMTIADVAERAGISPGLVHRIEKGAMSCSIGATFEVAAIVGVHLFDADLTTLRRHLAATRENLALLPKSVRRNPKALNDDF